jgi:hypothetical protein
MRLAGLIPFFASSLLLFRPPHLPCGSRYSRKRRHDTKSVFLTQTQCFCIDIWLQCNMWYKSQNKQVSITFFFNSATAASGPGSPHYRGFTITLRHTALGRAPLDEWPARRRDFYFKKYSTPMRQTSMPPAELEPTIPASERPQIHALHRAVTGIGRFPFLKHIKLPVFVTGTIPSL